MNPYPLWPNPNLDAWDTPGREWTTRVPGVTFSRHNLRYPPHFEFHWWGETLCLHGTGETPELAWIALKKLLRKHHVKRKRFTTSAK